MTIRTFIITAAIGCIITLTGCASKQTAKMDSGAQSTVVPAAAPPIAPAVTEKADDGIMTSSAIAENIPVSGETAEQTSSPSRELHLDPVYFDFDSYLLGADARDTLSRNARWLNDNKPARVIIEGHADERGSDEYNLALAEKRAIAAKRYIEALGVNPERMETVSYGENKPAMEGHDEAAWTKNRRAEFVIAR